MLGLKLNHVSKRGHRRQRKTEETPHDDVIARKLFPQGGLLCERNPPVTCRFPSQRTMDVEFWIILCHWHEEAHYCDAIMGTVASQITSLTIVYSTVYSDADQSKHQSSASLAFVWGIHRGPVNSPHKWPVTRKMLPFVDVIMYQTNNRVIGGLDAMYVRAWISNTFLSFTWKQSHIYALIIMLV